MKRGRAGWLFLLGLGMGCGGATRSSGEGDGTEVTNNVGGGAPTTAPARDLDAACRSQCSNTVLTRVGSCPLCHGKSLMLGGLDLESPGVAARLKDVPAKHIEIVPPSSQCPVGDKLIDSANVEQSWILKKLSGQQGTCGEAMPLPGALSTSDLGCMTTWIRCIAAE